MSDVDKNVDNATNAIIENLKKSMTQAVMYLQGEAKENAPVNDGVLRASIDYNIEADETSVTGTVGSSEFYAPYVHQGTGIHAINNDGRKTPWVYKDPKTGNFYQTDGQDPNPFLQKAIDENKEQIKKLLGGM